MQVLVHTDNHIKGSDDLSSRVEATVDGALERFGEQVTRVEVHLHDLNGHKHGIDKRCVMEARIAGHQPLAVTHDAASLDDAIAGAADKLENSLDHTLGRLDHRKGRMSFGGDQTI
jgi:ribosome-associated translation inhibitor RaiA